MIAAKMFGYVSCRVVSYSACVQHTRQSPMLCRSQQWPISRQYCTTVTRTDLSQTNNDPTRLRDPDRLYSKIELELNGHDNSVLTSYIWFLKQSAEHLRLQTVPDPPEDISETMAARRRRNRPHIRRITPLKSSFAVGKHRVHYEMRTYTKRVQLLQLTGSTADTYLEYAQRMLPEGVAMRVIRHAREALPAHLTF